jgi:hypothetical protein
MIERMNVWVLSVCVCVLCPGLFSYNYLDFLFYLPPTQDDGLGSSWAVSSYLVCLVMDTYLRGAWRYNMYAWGITI